MKALALAVLLAACGGSKQPPTAAPEAAPPAAPAAPAPDDGSGIATGSNDSPPGQADGSATVPAPGSCAAAGGRCTNKAAAVTCASQPPANDCMANEFCCKM